MTTAPRPPRILIPNLRRFMREGSLPSESPGGPWTKESSALYVAADRELRALLAVARAAQRGLTAPGQIHGPTWDRIDAALLRLERMTRKKARHAR